MATQTLTGVHENYVALTSMVKRWDRRLRLQQTLLWLPRSLLPGLIIGVVLAAISWLRPWLLPPQTALISGALVALGVVGFALTIWLWRRPTLLSAQRFDYRFGFNERVSTALELGAQSIRSSDELTQGQMAFAREKASAVRIGEHIPLILRGRDWALVIALAAVLALLLILPNPQVDALSDASIQNQAIKNATDQVRETTQDVAADTSLGNEQRRTLLEQLKTATNTLEQPNITPQEALAAVSNVESSLKDNADQLNQQSSLNQAALQQAANALRQASASSDNQQQQSSASMDQAAQNLDQMAQDASNMTQVQRQQAAQSLQNAANALQNTNPQAAQSLQQASQQMQQGNTQQAQQQMQQAQQQMQQQAQQAQQQQQAAQNLNQAAQQAQQSGQQISQAQQQSQQNQQQQSQQSQQQGQQQSQQQNQQQGQQSQQQGQQQNQQQGQQSQQQSQQQGQQQSQQQGQQQSQQSSQDGQQGQQPGQQGQQPGQQGQQPGQQSEQSQQGQQSGQNTTSQQSSALSAGDEPGDPRGDDNGQVQNTAQQGSAASNNPDGQGERPFEAVNVPLRLGNSANDGNNVQLDPDASNSPIQEGDFTENPNGLVTVPYNQVFSDYADAANQALNNDYVPLGLRDVVRDYFTSLEPKR